MTGLPIVARFSALRNHFSGIFRYRKTPPQTDLHTLWLHLQHLPRWAADSPTVLRTLDLLGPLPWDRFPDRDLQHNYGQPTVSYAAFAAASLSLNAIALRQPAGTVCGVVVIGYTERQFS